MNSGRLNRRVTLKKFAITRGTAGGFIETWTTLKTVWAAVEPLSGRELIQAQQLGSEADIRIRLRYVIGLTTKCRVICGNHTYEIVSAQNIGLGNEEWELLCHEAS